MAVTSLAELSAEEVQQALAYLGELLQERYPTLDLRQGVLEEILLLSAGQLRAAAEQEATTLRQSSSLAAILADPTLAEAAVVDNVVSNYLITREAGSPATGNIVIVVSKLESVTIANGAVFSANGKEFRTESVITARTSAANVLSSTDRVLQATGSGNYSFSVPVVAAEDGTASQLSKDTLVVPATRVPNFVKAYVSADFTGGRDEETNAALVNRAAYGISAKALSSRSSMSALLRENFTGVIADSIIGYGDSEQLRDRRSIFPISFGGRVDWYVRSRELPQNVSLTAEAVLLYKHSNNRGRWQLFIDREQAPGFYDVRYIRPVTQAEVAGTYQIQQETRTADLTAITGELLPDVQTATEAAFSRYQATTVQFDDTDLDVSSLTVGDKRDYSVTLRAMPNIAEIQALLGSRDVRNYAGDVLVKAAVPCFVSLSFLLQAPPGTLLPDVTAMQDALAAYVNQLGFSGRLAASAVSDIVHNYLHGRTHLVNLDMAGVILRPDGSTRHLRSNEALIIPGEPDKMVTPRTACFILEPADVVISARSINM